MINRASLAGDSVSVMLHRNAAFPRPVMEANVKEQGTDAKRWSTPRLVPMGTLRDVAGNGTARDQGNGKNSTNRS